MDRERLTWLRIAAVGFDAIALAAAWIGVVYLRIGLERTWPLDLFPGPEPVLRPVATSVHLPLLAVVVPVWLLALLSQGRFRVVRRERPSRQAAGTIAAAMLGLVLTLALLYALKLEYASRTVLVGFAVASVPTLAFSRWARHTLVESRRLQAVRRVLLVGSSAEARPLLATVARHPEWGIELVGRVAGPDDPADDDGLPPLGGLDDLEAVLVDHPIDEVYLTARHAGTPTLSRVARLCDEIGIRLSMDANFLGLHTARVEVADFEGWSVLTFGQSPSVGLELVLKRAMDVAGAAIALVLLAPLLALIAALVALSDRGPVLFVQERAGLFGRPFQMLKFRTMVPQAEQQLEALRPSNEMSGPVFKMEDDPRVTRVGRVLRRWSLDELPQLINVLRGEMSLVGPRPPLPDEVARYQRWQLRRLSMRPGLTCIWQVSGRNEVDFEQWLALDLEYIDRWSLWLDLLLLLRTVPAVLSRRGAR